MPDIPQLAEVNAVLKNYMVFSGRPDAFPLQLKQYLSGIQHDNMEVCKQVGTTPLSSFFNYLCKWDL